MTKALVSGEIIIKDLPEPVFHELRQELSFLNPNYVNSQRYSKSGNVNPNIPQIIHTVKNDKFGYAHCPRGAIVPIRKILDKHGIKLELMDGRSTGKPIDCAAVFGLRPYQRTAQLEAIKRVQGVITLPCGGGKTVIGVSILGKLKRTSLIIVHTKDLRDQWIEQLAKIRIKCGQIGDGVMDMQPVTVAIVDSMETVIKEKENRKKLRQFGLVLVDEAHHVPSATFQRILPHLPAKYRYGLTATPDREDGLTHLMYWTLGDILFSYPTDKLIKEGYLMNATVVPIETDFRYKSDDSDINSSEYSHRLTEALIGDDERNRLICNLAVKEAKDGEIVLVLSNRREHCAILAEMMRLKGAKATDLTGKTKKKDRQEIIKQFRTGKIQIVTATSIADEGLDVPRLSRMIMALPGKARGRTMQRAGRVMRPGVGKTAKIYDIVDARIPMLLTRWWQRKRTYESISLDVLQPRMIII